MTDTELTKETADLLKSKPTEAECQEALEAVESRLTELRRRRGQIRAAHGKSDPGPERRAAIDGGDAERVAELDRELQGVSAETEVLLSQRRKLQRAAVAARVRAAVPRAEGLASELPAALDELEAAQEDLRTTRAAVDDLLAELRECRRIATGRIPELSSRHRGKYKGLDREVDTLSDEDCPGLDPATFDRAKRVLSVQLEELEPMRVSRQRRQGRPEMMEKQLPDVHPRQVGLEGVLQGEPEFEEAEPVEAA